jgi:hypothetical protein
MFQHKVVVVAGDEARKTFFNDKDLSFEQGYRLLRGGVSQLHWMAWISVKLTISSADSEVKGYQSSQGGCQH